MNNSEVYAIDPLKRKLVNEGVAKLDPGCLIRILQGASLDDLDALQKDGPVVRLKELRF